MTRSALVAALALVAGAASAPAQDAAADARTIRMPRHPQVSPNGSQIAFSWQKDIWVAPIGGGDARRVTTHPADDESPRWSPDGKTIAFTSDRAGGRSQVFLIAATGGAARQVTTASGRRSLLGFTADGAHLVFVESTDRHFHSTENRRVFTYALSGDEPKRMLFDAGVSNAALSPSGDKVLFTRGRASWTRKGYRGAAAEQLWLADLARKPAKLTRLDADDPNFQNASSMQPMWAPDGQSYYYVSDPDGTFDVYHRPLAGGAAKRITNVGSRDRSDDGVHYASLSADGKTLVFRRRFDLHRVDLDGGATAPIALHATGDAVISPVQRLTAGSADGVAFTEDGKQIAFTAGEDLWVMDRILREPIRLTHTPHRESSPVFSADGKRLFFVTDSSGEVDIWEATTSQEDGIWWLTTPSELKLRKVTDDAAVESGLRISPTGEHIAYLRDSQIFVMDSDGSDHRRIVASWSRSSFDWAPDGKWLAYATQDDDYNSDVWVVPLDGTREPFNVSRHPDSDSSPAWSGDGKRLAFVSRREGEESDIYWVDLTKDEAEETDRDRKLAKALKAMKEPARRGSSRSGGNEPSGGSNEPGRAGPRGRGGRGRGGRGGFRRPGGGGRPSTPPTAAAPSGDTPSGESSASRPSRGDGDDDKKVEVTIDFDGLLDRVRRISIPDSRESGLIWSPDGKKLAFSASVDGERGFYTVSFPDVGSPSRMASSGLGSARWLKKTNEIVGLGSGGGATRGGGSPRGPRGRFAGFFGRGGGTPAAMSARGSTETFGFSIRHQRDWRELRKIAFDQGWRAMRDRFYDVAMNNRDWEKVREKYRAVAAECLGADEFSELMNMMLGELNASHMGHRGGADPLPGFDSADQWSPTTYHLGLRFDPFATGDGLVVESVIPGSPCSEKRSRVEAGEILLAIDGTPVGPDVNLDKLLTMEQARDVELSIADGEGNERKVKVRPTTSVARLLYDEFVENTRRAVDEQSEGRLGYLHIQGMNMSSFRQMETDLYHAGAGKDGLIIDVRFNGGGSTTDHVLTALTQPVHAITVSRGSGEGYPQDRKVYASWSKPIVLMCNEHSFSNAEILSHAVKQLGRGRLVGMRTAGGVISTGSQRLLDGSSVRMPTRGWYLVASGEDMELNGCEPNIALWNPPDGGDVQLETAVKTLLADVAAWQAKGRVKIEPAATKRRNARAAEAGGDGDE